MEKKENEGFHDTYSAKEQAEIQNIRKKYTAPDESEDKMAQIRRLDAGVGKKATKAALIVGVIGALRMGVGMSLAMTNLSELLGSYRNLSMAVGIVIGIRGY